ncbi:tRNA(Ile)-lysidine synthase [Porphyromonas crevioricanis]|uniref:tRNA(Ile)-lysidine synthase n=2 Tax=Porphyromonas crevioricanis TaxID=393921 RepID=A0A2X4PMG6_9PORP|nr:tRNA(Ile)-lysidine synthase [Porphyromonas crevioricanis]SQH73565.1 tRNA(Ile)-lysidine synthase [Porphyromonas crevioricanis]
MSRWGLSFCPINMQQGIHTPHTEAIEKQIKKELNQAGLRVQDLIIVGVSGGADSVALLLSLYRLGCLVEAAHCNFSLRPGDCEEDEVFVQKLCQDLDIPIRHITFDTTSYAQKHGISIEMSARKLRYTWFEELMQSRQASALALAHHRDDNIETLLLNLTAGTGLRGLTAMRTWSKQRIFRPLLHFSRKEIEEYLSDIDQDYRIDKSNTDTTYKRNFVRHRLIPLLKEINPSVEKAIDRTIDNLQGVEDIFEEQLSESVIRFYREGKISMEEVLSSASVPTFLFELLRPAHFSRVMIRDIYQRLSNSSGAVYDSPTHRLVRSTNSLHIYPLASLLDQHDVKEILIPINNTEQGECLFPHNKDLKLCWRIVDRQMFGASLRLPLNMALFDYNKLGQLSLRLKQAGEKIYPFGMKGSKKISKLLIDCKYPLQERDMDLLCSDNTPIWVPGLVADRRFGVDANTKCCLLCSISKTTNEE